MDPNGKTFGYLVFFHAWLRKVWGFTPDCDFIAVCASHGVKCTIQTGTEVVVETTP